MGEGVSNTWVVGLHHIFPHDRPEVFEVHALPGERKEVLIGADLYLVPRIIVVRAGDLEEGT